MSHLCRCQRGFVLRNFTQNPLQPFVRNFVENGSSGEVVGEDEVA
jgi:hypothetical protein